MGEIRGAYRILVGKPQGKVRLGGPSYRWEDNIKKLKKWGMMSELVLSGSEYVSGGML
jgi:hypothetical protein